MFDSLSSSSSALLNAVVIGATNVVATFVGLLLVDRLGRRPLLLQGGVQMMASQVGAPGWRRAGWPGDEGTPPCIDTCLPGLATTRRAAPPCLQVATAVVLARSLHADASIDTGPAVVTLVLICLFVAGFAWSW
jgi:hypothetical protein